MLNQSVDGAHHTFNRHNIIFISTLYLIFMWAIYLGTELWNFLHEHKRMHERSYRMKIESMRLWNIHIVHEKVDEIFWTVHWRQIYSILTNDIKYLVTMFRYMENILGNKNYQFWWRKYWRVTKSSNVNEVHDFSN